MTRTDGDQRPCTVEELVGIWDPVESEIENYDLESEVYEFTTDSKFVLVHPKLEQRNKRWVYDYRIDGLTLTYFLNGPTKDGITIGAWFEKNLLVFHPHHGNHTHSRKRC